MQASRSSSARVRSTRARATTLPPMHMPCAVPRRGRPFWVRLEYADHGAEDGLKGAPGGVAAAGDVGGQGDHGAGILNVFKMLAGEIGADDLGANVAGGDVHFDAFPTTFPIGVGEEAGEDLGVEIALAFEIAVEAAVGQARAEHDLLDGDTLETIAIEELAGYR
jgi:hypothetical protein